MKVMEVLISQRTETEPSEIEELALAVEYLLLTRQIALNTCILGKYMQEHKVPGTNVLSSPDTHTLSLPHSLQVLKTELRRLSSAISFMVHCMPEANVKVEKINLQCAPSSLSLHYSHPSEMLRTE